MTPAELIAPALLEALSPGAQARHVEALAGGVSAQVVALELARADGEVEALVVRHRPTDAAGEGLSVAQEHALMAFLFTAGVPVPRPRLLWSRDTMVMARVAGTTALPADAPRHIAEALVLIHALALPSTAAVALPQREDPAEAIAHALGHTRLREVEAIRAALHTEDHALLHGDMWPGNLLWHHDRLAAILDWEDAAQGDPLSDLACARVELEVVAGRAASDALTAHYLQRTGADPARLPLWDLYVTTAALGAMHAWGLPSHELAQRREVTTACRDRARTALAR